MSLIPFFFIAIFLFVMGAVIASFLNVVVYRTARGQSWLRGRSRCESCHKKIAWRDNIPLLSFYLLKGRCRHCKKVISLVHPLVEFGTALLFIAWGWLVFFYFDLQHPWQFLQAFFWLLVAILLWVILIADILYFFIPDFAVVILSILVLAYRFALIKLGLMEFNDFLLTLLSMLVVVLFFFSLWFFTKGRGFGFGDVKLAVPLVLLLGFPQVVIGIFFAFILGSIAAIILLITGKKKFGQVIPFGPFLIVATIIGIIWGKTIWAYWLFI
ncbi:MAG: prepilin peptidase [Candidatus Woesebacteria bacterium]|jgi:leader peptidase (prepilin peptidase)/N-methyltransferase